MALRAYLQMLRRRWYVLAMLVACTALVAVLVPREPGAYWTRATVVFVPPVNPARLGNVLEGSDPSLVYFAAAVERAVNNGTPGPRLSSTSATLYGAGVRQGHTIGLLNSGGQWQTNYNRPMLNVEVVDVSAQAAQDVVDDILTRIEATALSMQRDAGARSAVLIRTELSPQVPVITFIPGNHGRALVGMALLGAGVSLAGTCWVDQLLGRRRREIDSGQPVQAV